MKKINNTAIITGVILVLVSAVMRVVNAEMHWYNFAPYVAMSLFSGAVFKRTPAAFILPLAALFLSDVAFYFFTDIPAFYGISQTFVYAAMALVALWGSFMKKRNVLNVLGFSIGGSLVFWLVSNFGVFLSGFYGSGIEGLTATYALALPFYRSDVSTDLFLNALIGDIIFNGLLFGIYGFVTAQSARTALAK